MQVARLAQVALVSAVLAPAAWAADPSPPAPPAPSASGVAVYRGPGSGPLPPVAASRSEPRTMSGRNLWVVDETRDTAVGCRIEGTSTVGKRRLACVRSRVPQP